MKIEIDLDEYFEGGLEDRIMCGVITQIADRLHDRVLKELTTTIAKQVQATVEREVDSLIGEKLRAEIPVLSTWGEPTDKTTTLGALVAAQWETSLKKAAQYGNGNTGLQQMIAKYALSGLEKEATIILSKLNEEAKLRIQEAIKTIVASQLTKNIKGV